MKNNDIFQNKKIERSVALFYIFANLSPLALLRYNWCVINCTYLKCLICWVLTSVHTWEASIIIKIMNVSSTPKRFHVSLCKAHPSLLQTYYYESLQSFLLGPEFQELWWLVKNSTAGKWQSWGPRPSPQALVPRAFPPSILYLHGDEYSPFPLWDF